MRGAPGAARVALLGAGLLGAGLVGGACRCAPPLESAVDVPITVEGAEALHAPPEVVVTVERVVTKVGGGACGHSPLCVIVLPAILLAEMFPPMHDEVVIVDHGQETYRASFSTRGDFLQARVQKDGVVRDLRQLRLEELGRRLVVEVARSPAANAPPAPVAVAPQGDLLGAYARALEKADDERCGRLLVEATTWLGDEARPFVRAQMQDAARSDGCKAHVIERACSTADGAPDPRAADVVLAAAAAPGPKTAAAGVGCALASLTSSGNGGARVLEPERALPFTQALVDHVCARRAPTRAWQEALADRAWRATAQAEGSRCKAPHAAAWFALTLDAPVDAKALEAAIASMPWGPEVVRELDVPEHAALLVRALENDDTDVAALEALHAGLKSDATKPTIGGRELAALYVRGPDGSLCDGHTRRVQIAELLLALPEGERAKARAELARAEPSDVTGALRRALGDSEPARLGPNAMAARRDGDGGTQCSDRLVAARVLFLGGCAVEGDRVVCAQ